MSTCLLKPKQKIVFIGDSITDCGRRGGPNAPYGAGYVKIVRDLLLARYPGYGLTIENRGIGGNTIRDLKARWQEDVIAAQPAVLSIKIGINDVWRQVAGRLDEAVLFDEYEATYRTLLKLTCETVAPTLILVDPYILDTDPNDAFRSILTPYIDCVHRLADEFGAVSVRTQDAFDEVLTQTPSSFWADDRVHPNSPGHAVIARAFLNAIGYEF